SHVSTVSGARGLDGFANHGSNRTVTPPGVTSSMQAWPYHVMAVDPLASMCATSTRHRIHGPPGTRITAAVRWHRLGDLRALRLVALLALPVVAAVYGVALLRGRRAAPVAMAGLGVAGLVLVTGALSWGGGGLDSLLLLVELAGLSVVLGGVWAAMVLGHWY